jgi:hypothetical protein
MQADGCHDCATNRGLDHSGGRSSWCHDGQCWVVAPDRPRAVVGPHPEPRWEARTEQHDDSSGSAPVNETGYRLLMRAQADQDGGAAALVTYERLRGLLRQELRVAPGPLTQQLIEQLLT